MLHTGKLELFLDWISNHPQDSTEIFRVPHTGQIVQEPRISLEFPALVDFPRVAYEAIGTFLINYISEGLNEKSPRELLSELLNEKEQVNTPFGQVTSILKTLGIEWDARVSPVNEGIIITVEPEEYYRSVWPKKILEFIELLDTGKDYPSNIYEIASILTPQLPLQEFAKPYSVDLPMIFKLLATQEDFNMVVELEKLRKSILSLYGLIMASTELPENYGRQIIAWNGLTKIFYDILGLINHLEVLLEVGHFHSGYNVLRSLIRDLGDALIVVSLAQYYESIASELRDKSLKEEDKESAVYVGLEQVKEKFVDTWLKVYYDKEGRPFSGDVPLEARENYNETYTIRTLGELRKELEYGIFMEFYRDGYAIRTTRKNRTEKYSIIDFADRVCYESVDMFIQTGKLPFEVALDRTVSLPTKKSFGDPSKFPVANEYHKLSDVVHNPVLVDFPPYSSTIEYLGFLHHLKLVRKIFEDVLKVYRGRISKNSQKRRNE